MFFEVSSNIAIIWNLHFETVSPLGKNILSFVSSKTGINGSNILFDASCKLSKIIMQFSILFFELSIASKNLLLDSSNFNPESVCFGIVLQNKSSTVVVLKLKNKFLLILEY